MGAIDSIGSIFDLSSRGPTANGEIKPDLVTLGVDVVSALAGSKNGQELHERHLHGRSSGLRSLGHSAGSRSLILKPTDVKRMLLKTADDLGQSGPDNVYGYGALNLTSALQSMQVRIAEGSSPPVLEE